MSKKKNKNKPQAVTSYVSDGTLTEMVYDEAQQKTSFITLNKKGAIKISASIETTIGNTLIPYSAEHAFVKDRVILFAQKPEPYGEIAKLITAIRNYIHRYVDLSEEFEVIAIHYVLLTWLYDLHNVLGYLRIKGDFGTGKTRFLTVIGSICYKPIFASGAATVAPLFHILNDIGGTLIMDESDFYQSTEQSLIAKILNNGNAKGFPVLRCEKMKDQSFTTRSFTVYGPKILACRGPFDDAALESRFLTENAGVRPLRPDVPLSLGDEQEQDAQKLRNQLLQFRFDYFYRGASSNSEISTDISPRMQQIVRPLMQFMSNSDCQQVLAWAKANESQQCSDRGMELAAQILTVLQHTLKNTTSSEIGQIRNRIMEDYGDHYERPITAKAVGNVVRNTLHLSTKRVRGRYVVQSFEKDKIALLAKRYGVYNVT